MAGAGDYILIVDDSRTNVVLLEEVLEEHGFKTKMAASGTDAWNCVKRNSPRLMLLDLHLPGLTGADLLKRMKGEQIFRDVPVIIMSASGDRQTIEQLMNLGAHDFFSKPLDIKRLIVAIRQLISPLTQNNPRTLVR